MKSAGTDNLLSSDMQVDVAIIGSGAAGFSAALTAAAEGLDVVIIEKADVFGGTTAISGGAIWIPGSSHAKRMGADDSREKVTTYLKNLLGNHYSGDLIETYLDAAPEAIDYLETHSHLRFIPREYSPDYHSDLEGSVMGGRTMDTAHYNGRKLGKRFADIRSPLPQFMAFGGLMVTMDDVANLKNIKKSPKAFLKLAALGARFAFDKLSYPRGTRLVYGNAMIAAMYRSALDAGITMFRGAEAKGLIRDGDRIAGVNVASAVGEYQIMAKRGVVLATGGASHNEQWRRENLPTPDAHFSMAPRTNTGDGLEMGKEALGRVADNNARNAFFAPVSKLPIGKGRAVQFPHLMGDRQMPGSIAVGCDGRRFVNEAESYHRFASAMVEADEDGSHVPVHLICDSVFLRKYGMGMARVDTKAYGKLIQAGYLIQAESIDDLAAKIGVPQDNLAETVSAANRFAESGVDKEFGKGSTAYNRYLGDASHSPNPCLGPIKEAPFFAIKLWPGDIGSAAGLVCDSNARVLDSDGQPIDGLYACGNDMNSIWSGFYPGGGITIGPGLTFGYLAAKHMAGQALSRASQMSLP